jgi:Fe-S cluster assembly protein SufB
MDFVRRAWVSWIRSPTDANGSGKADAMATTQQEHLDELSKGYRFGWHDPETYVFKPKKGLNPQVVEEISGIKNEPDWMRKFRLKALRHFEGRPMPWWGADLSEIDFQNIYYYLKPTEGQAKTWDDLPEDIRGTWDKLGIPEAEKKYLGGVSAQYESEVVYHKIKDELDQMGVIFTDTDSALRDHPDLFKEYFGTIIPPNDNKLAALNSAVWSGGSFIYVPPGVHVDIPLQAYFRINAENVGQFERTLIIADEGSYVHYVEGCSAPIYTTDSLHSAVVEIIVKKGARARYTTIQNWSSNVYNLVTKRAAAYEDSVMEWVDGNIGSKVTMKYPSIYLLGKGARGEVLSVAFAGKGQHQDAGGKAIHAAPHTTSVITSKSVSKDGGRTGYRGLVRVEPGADHAKSMVRCDALILDERSRSDTYPYVEVEEESAQLGHEASVARIGEDQLFYLMSRGLSEAEASAMIVNGFIEPITRELPMEYAVELNRLIELQMEGAIG